MVTNWVLLTLNDEERSVFCIKLCNELLICLIPSDSISMQSLVKHNKNEQLECQSDTFRGRCNNKFYLRLFKISFSA